MNRLYVLYDAECALCRRCRDWLARQPRWIELEFVALQSPDLARRFKGIEALRPGEQLLVVSDTGAVYRGSHAWIMCLYALPAYRAWAQRLATPALQPWARRVCELVSQNRLRLSRLLLRQSAAEIGRTLAARSASAAHMQVRGREPRCGC
jgi:predicted DCC family thiol-disulfide oxidoreductase YuxK